jgi:hypothetical protein
VVEVEWSDKNKPDRLPVRMGLIRDGGQAAKSPRVLPVGTPRIQFWTVGVDVPQTQSDVISRAAGAQSKIRCP